MQQQQQQLAPKQGRWCVRMRVCEYVVDEFSPHHFFVKKEMLAAFVHDDDDVCVCLCA
jgi:hypothetical protein